MHVHCANIIVRFSTTTYKCNYNNYYKTAALSKCPQQQIQVTQAASASVLNLYTSQEMALVLILFIQPIFYDKLAFSGVW